MKLKKGTKAYSILNNRCPKCQEGKFWPTNNPYRNIFIRNVGILGSCNQCNLKFEQEVGFWFGAMYVSYALAVIIILFSWILIRLIAPGTDIVITSSIISCNIILFSPVNYFLSRLCWVNIFVNYE